MKFALCVLACAFASVALATPPPAPTITAAATDIKQLQFDITPVVRVGWYELWFKANPGAAWVNYTRTRPQRPLFRIGTSVHLLDWKQARYLVKACNSSGCTPSNEVGVDGEQLAAMGFFKPASTGPYQYFGYNSIAVSADGTTLVAVASERLNSVPVKAGIHVYRKSTATSGWRLDGHFSPVPNFRTCNGNTLAISADGFTIAFGSCQENDFAGAVYLFRRASDGWHQTQRIASATAGDAFGENLDLDGAGKTLFIAHRRSGGQQRFGTLEVYQDPDDSSNQFVHATTIPTPPFDVPADGACYKVAVSDVGHIVQSCFSGSTNYYYARVLTAISTAPLQYAETARLPSTHGDVAIDSAGQRLAIRENRDGVFVVGVYRRGTTSWVRDGTLDQIAARSIAISGDGKWIAVGDVGDTLIGAGPVFPPYQYVPNPDPAGLDWTGTVAVYERHSSGWRLRRYVKGDNQTVNSFAMSVALDRAGKTLAVASPEDASKAVGIDGDRHNASSPKRGAVWLY